MRNFTQSFETFLRVRYYPWRTAIGIFSGLAFGQGVGQVTVYDHRVLGFLMMVIPAILFTLSVFAIKLHWRFLKDKARRQGFLTSEDLR